MTQTVIQSELCRGGGGEGDGGSPSDKNCLGGAASPPNSRMRGEHLVSPVDPSPLYREKVFEDSDSSWRKKKTEIGCQVQEAVKDNNSPWQCPCNSNQRFCSLQVILIYNGYLHDKATTDRVGHHPETPSTLQPCHVHPDFRLERDGKHIHDLGTTEKVSTAQENSQKLYHSHEQPRYLWPGSRNNVHSI